MFLLNNFLKLVEIATKAASFIPYLLGTAFAYYNYNSFNPVVFFLMFVSLLFFDMTTTTINNYIDHNYVGFKPNTVLKIIFIMLSIACIFGILLVLKTNIIVLVIGIISFLAGIFYTFGPIPISRMPLGEIFSGFFMGFIIILLAVFIQVPNNLMSINLIGTLLTLTADLKELIIILVFSIPAINSIANIMLANNICDLEEDILIKRFTLPYYIGIENSMKLFRFLYYIAFAAMASLIFLGKTPWFNSLALIGFFPVNKNINTFVNNPDKRKTFILSVKNFMIINLPQVILITMAKAFV